MISPPGYRIVAELGSGASASVYRAVQLGLDREVALKVLSPGLFGGRETQARFVREARIQANLSHPNLLRLFDAGIVDGHPYMAVELVDGGSLRECLERDHSLPIPQVLRLGRQIAEGLMHAHSSGIVHRDLKPENVLLTRAGQAKVADFGLAKGLSAHNTVETSAGTLLGTPGYMPPEALEGRATGPLADVYALGVMLYEMALGQRPFGGDDLGAVLRSQISGVFTPLVERDAGIPAGLDALVKACLAREPSERPASAAEVAARLAALEGEMLASPDQATSQLKVPTGGPVSQRAGSRRGGASSPGRGVARTSASRPVPAVREATFARHPTLRDGGAGARSETTARRLAWGAGVPVLLALGVVALVWLRTGPFKEETGLPANVASRDRGEEPALTEGIGAAPGLLHLAAGIDSAVVTLTRPATAPVELTLTDSKRTWGRSYVIGKGESGISIGGLPAATGLAVEMPGVERVSFDTLKPTREGWIVLDRNPALTLEVASRGDHIVAAWTRSGATTTTIVRESFDGGSTWTLARSLNELSGEAGFPAIAILPDGVAVAGIERDQRGSGVELFGRTARDFRWRRIAEAPGTHHDPVLMLTGERRLGLYVWGGDDRIDRLELEWPTGKLLSREEAVARMPHHHPDRKCWWLAGEPGSSAAFSVLKPFEELRESSPGDPRLKTTQIAFCRQLTGGRFGEMQTSFEPTSDDNNSLDVQTLPSGRIVVARAADGGVFACFSDDGGAKFSPWEPIWDIDAHVAKLNPVAVAGGTGRCYLLHWYLGTASALVLHASEDGSGWEQLQRLRMPLSTSFVTLRAAVTEKGLLAFISDAGGGGGLYLLKLEESALRVQPTG